jgi:hypothetical protein
MKETLMMRLVDDGNILLFMNLSYEYLINQPAPFQSVDNDISSMTNVLM